MSRREQAVLIGISAFTRIRDFRGVQRGVAMRCRRFVGRCEDSAICSALRKMVSGAGRGG